MRKTFSFIIILFHILSVFHFLNCLKKFKDLILSKEDLSSNQSFKGWNYLGVLSI